MTRENLEKLIDFTRDESVTIEAKGLMLYMLAHANHYGWCYATPAKMMKDLNIKEETLNKCLKELEETGDVSNRKGQINSVEFNQNEYWVNWVIE